MNFGNISLMCQMSFSTHCWFRISQKNLTLSLCKPIALRAGSKMEKGLPAGATINPVQLTPRSYLNFPQHDIHSVCFPFLAVSTSGRWILAGKNASEVPRWNWPTRPLSVGQGVTMVLKSWEPSSYTSGGAGGSEGVLFLKAPST